MRNSLKTGLISLSLFMLNVPLYAEDNPPPIAPGLYKQLSKAETLIGKKKYSEARQRLNKILADVQDNSYEQAIILRSLASIYTFENQYKQSAQLLEQSLATNALTDTQQQESILNLGQLYMATEQYKKAVDTLAPWLNKHPNTTNTQVWILLANGYAQLKQYRKALPYIEHVIKNAKKPQTSWLELNLALYYEIQDYSSAAGILKRLITLEPDKQNYWQQLASIYQQLQQYDNALTIQNLAYKKGFLNSESKKLALFNLFLYNKQPYQAAVLLEKELNAKGIKQTSANWELLANAWTSAREYKNAIKALDKASTLNASGQLYLQLGRIHIEQESWQDAISAINKALKKGGLKQSGEAYILLGISYYEAGQLQAANKAFTNAQDYSKTRKSAEQWLGYITMDARG
ncbi:tetratricopeptide repeat protein [Methyloprofundus sedimenti]|nr:tetratricopeptide repeat protein [Methyloprofundus sedimenti]